jgi:hypothetical protein
MLMLENATPLPVKAAGGVRTYDRRSEMIKLGVKRIGTSGAKAIAMEEIQMWDTNFTIKNMKKEFVRFSFIIFFFLQLFARPRFIRVKYFSDAFLFSAL